MHLCPDELIPLQPFFTMAWTWFVSALRLVRTRGKSLFQYLRKTNQTKF